MEVSIILLAAGSSTRMGQSKQLLAWGDGTLLTHAVQTALHSKASKVYVVLGDREAEHSALISSLPVTIVRNPRWASGMGSSLKSGLQEARTHSQAVMVLVCDQPFVTAHHLDQLIEAYATTGKTIVASMYGDTAGVPALFDRTWFDEMMQLDDGEGARKLIHKYREQCGIVPLDRGEADIDTPEDYAKSLRASGQSDSR